MSKELQEYNIQNTDFSLSLLYKPIVDRCKILKLKKSELKIPIYEFNSEGIIVELDLNKFQEFVYVKFHEKNHKFPTNNFMLLGETQLCMIIKQPVQLKTNFTNVSFSANKHEFYANTIYGGNNLYIKLSEDFFQVIYAPSDGFINCNGEQIKVDKNDFLLKDLSSNTLSVKKPKDYLFLYQCDSKGAIVRGPIMHGSKLPRLLPKDKHINSNTPFNNDIWKFIFLQLSVKVLWQSMPVSKDWYFCVKWAIFKKSRAVFDPQQQHLPYEALAEAEIQENHLHHYLSIYLGNLQNEQKLVISSSTSEMSLIDSWVKKTSKEFALKISGVGLDNLPKLKIPDRTKTIELIIGDSRYSTKLFNYEWDDLCALLKQDRISKLVFNINDLAFFNHNSRELWTVVDNKTQEFLDALKCASNLKELIFDSHFFQMSNEFCKKLFETLDSPDSKVYLSHLSFECPGLGNSAIVALSKFKRAKYITNLGIHFTSNHEEYGTYSRDIDNFIGNFPNLIHLNIKQDGVYTKYVFQTFAPCIRPQLKSLVIDLNNTEFEDTDSLTIYTITSTINESNLEVLVIKQFRGSEKAYNNIVNNITSRTITNLNIQGAIRANLGNQIRLEFNSFDDTFTSRNGVLKKIDKGRSL